MTMLTLVELALDPNTKVHQTILRGIELAGDVGMTIRKLKGFDTPSSIDEFDLVIVKLALVHEEVSEAVSAARVGDLENFKEELADATIRILDLATTMGIDLGAEILKKCVANLKRPYKHGKRA